MARISKIVSDAMNEIAEECEMPLSADDKSSKLIGGLAGVMAGSVAGLVLGGITGAVGGRDGVLSGGFRGALTGVLVGATLGGIAGAMVEKKDEAEFDEGLEAAAEDEEASTDDEEQEPAVDEVQEPTVEEEKPEDTESVETETADVCVAVASRAWVAGMELPAVRFEKLFHLDDASLSAFRGWSPLFAISMQPLPSYLEIGSPIKHLRREEAAFGDELRISLQFVPVALLP